MTRDHRRSSSASASWRWVKSVASRPNAAVPPALPQETRRWIWPLTTPGQAGYGTDLPRRGPALPPVQRSGCGAALANGATRAAPTSGSLGRGRTARFPPAPAAASRAAEPGLTKTVMRRSRAATGALPSASARAAADGTPRRHPPPRAAATFAPPSGPGGARSWPRCRCRARAAGEHGDGPASGRRPRRRAAPSTGLYRRPPECLTALRHRPDL